MNLYSSNFWNQAIAISDEASFNECALDLFRYQSKNVKIYSEYLRLLNRDPYTVKHFSEIPFLPVTLFKNNIITDQEQIPDFYFSSSGTTGQVTSRHYIVDIEIYHQSLDASFKFFYGSPDQYRFLFLLPSYLEREGSSLVYMAERLIQSSENAKSGFYLYNHDEMSLSIQEGLKNGEKIFLWGVTYALLDYFEQYPAQLKDVIIMETGGMKGKRTELIKKEVHNILSEKSGIRNIHSEYGMTELLSQAYSTGNGIFSCPPWMKILISDLHDPFTNLVPHDTGIIKVIDLANIHSCAFIETQDLGRKVDESHFEVLGRMDHSEWRGCNMMIG